MKTIEPLDATLQAPDPIPKRERVLGDEYHPPVLGEADSEHGTAIPVKPAADTRRKVRYRDAFVLNALVTVPYGISYISISAIFALPQGADIETAATSRIAMILLAVPVLVSCVVAAIKLRTELWNYEIRLAAFIFIYSLFIFPAINVSIGLQTRGIPIAVIFVVTAILSQVYLLGVVASLKDTRFVLLPVGIVVALVVFSIVLT